MNVNLQIYNDDYKEDMILCIARFFGFHLGLSSEGAIDNIDTSIAEQDLNEWTTKENQLYMIMYANNVAGFYVLVIEVETLLGSKMFL